MQLLLNIATLLGGVSATWFLWDKLRDWSHRFPERRPHERRGDSELPKMLEPAMRVVFSVVAVVCGGLGWFIMARDAEWFLPVFAVGMLCGFGATKISDRHTIVKGIVTLIAIWIVVAVVASFPELLILQFFGVIPTPQAAFFYGAGIVALCIFVIWLNERQLDKQTSAP